MDNTFSFADQFGLSLSKSGILDFLECYAINIGTPYEESYLNFRRNIQKERASSNSQLFDINTYWSIVQEFRKAFLDGKNMSATYIESKVIPSNSGYSFAFGFAIASVKSKIVRAWEIINSPNGSVDQVKSETGLDEQIAQIMLSAAAG